jgi:hypothetical protein
MSLSPDWNWFFQGIIPLTKPLRYVTIDLEMKQRPDFASRKSKNPNEIKVKEAEKAK